MSSLIVRPSRSNDPRANKCYYVLHYWDGNKNTMKTIGHMDCNGRFVSNINGDLLAKEIAKTTEKIHELEDKLNILIELYSSKAASYTLEEVLDFYDKLEDLI